MASKTCTHGLIQQQKFGIEQRDGLDICLGCQLPTQESVQRARASAPPSEPRTPRDRARTARQQGQTFFELQLEIGASNRDVRFGEADSGGRSEQDNAHVLQQIENEGWHLQHAGYVFVPTGQSTRQKILGTGESVAVSGVMVGIYLFKAAPTPSSS